MTDAAEEFVRRAPRLPRPPRRPAVPLSGTGIVAFLLLLLGGAFALMWNGFDNEFAGLLGVRSLTIDTWEEWCDHVAATDLRKKYGAMDVSYEPDSIRADFVRVCATTLARWCVADTAASALNDAVRAGAVKIRNEGTTLRLTTTLTADVSQWRKSLEENLREDWSRLPRDEFLVNATLSSMFTELILEGSNGQTASIRLPFSFGK